MQLRWNSHKINDDCKVVLVYKGSHHHYSQGRNEVVTVLDNTDFNIQNCILYEAFSETCIWYEDHSNFMWIINEMGHEGFDKKHVIFTHSFSWSEFQIGKTVNFVWTLKWTCRHPAQKATTSRWAKNLVSFCFQMIFRYAWFAMIEQQAIILTRWPAKVAKDFFEEQ